MLQIGLQSLLRVGAVSDTQADELVVAWDAYAVQACTAKGLQVAGPAELVDQTEKGVYVRLWADCKPYAALQAYEMLESMSHGVDLLLNVQGEFTPAQLAHLEAIYNVINPGDWAVTMDDGADKPISILSLSISGEINFNLFVTALAVVGCK